MRRTTAAPGGRAPATLTISTPGTELHEPHLARRKTNTTRFGLAAATPGAIIPVLYVETYETEEDEQTSRTIVEACGASSESWRVVHAEHASHRRTTRGRPARGDDPNCRWTSERGDRVRPRAARHVYSSTIRSNRQA